MKHKFGQGWYHDESEHHPDHDKPYERLDLPLNCFAKLRCNIGVYKVVLDALNTFLQEDKSLFWNNFSIKNHHGSPYHILRSRISIIDDPKTSWRLIVDLRPDDGVVEVVLVSPVRDYKQINDAVRRLLKEHHHAR